MAIALPLTPPTVGPCDGEGERIAIPSIGGDFRLSDMLDWRPCRCVPWLDTVSALDRLSEIDRRRPGSIPRACRDGSEGEAVADRTGESRRGGLRIELCMLAMPASSRAGCSAVAPRQNRAKMGEHTKRRSAYENRQAWDEMILPMRSIQALTASAGVAGLMASKGAG